MIGSILIGLLQWIPGLTVKDEKARAGAKAAVAGTVGCAVAIFDPLEAVVASLLAAKEAVDLTRGDDDAKRGTKTGLDLAAGGVGLDPVSILLRYGGGIAGGLVAKASRGKMDIVEGITLGASLADARLVAFGAKVAGATVGTAAGMLPTANDKTRVKNALTGARLGIAVAGGLADVCSETLENEATSIEAEIQRHVAEVRRRGIERLAAALGGAGVGAGIYALSNGEADASECISTGVGLVGASIGVLHANTSDGLDVAARMASLSSAIAKEEGERIVKTALKRAEAKAQEGDWTAAKKAVRLRATFEALENVAGVLGDTADAPAVRDFLRDVASGRAHVHSSWRRLEDSTSST